MTLAMAFTPADRLCIPVPLYHCFGMVMSSLRHEVMHAQLHATVGCMPAWFDEGLAMYFSGAPRTREWIKMLRAPEALEMRWLEQSTLEDVDPDRVSWVYAQSLAMLLYVIDRAGEVGLRDAVQTVHFAGADARKLWEKLYPGTGDRQVLDALARKMFGVPQGPELDTMLQGTICCYGLKSVSTFGCRSVTRRHITRFFRGQVTSVPHGNRQFFIRFGQTSKFA